MYTHASLPLPHPIPLGHQGALSWAPCVIQLLLTCCLFYAITVYVNVTLPVHPILCSSPSLCPRVCPLYLHVHSCPANRLFGATKPIYHTISLDSIYMYYILYLFFSFWRRKTLSYFALYDRLWVHPHHYRWPSFIPFYGWVIFHCMYVPHLYPFICWWTSSLLTASAWTVLIFLSKWLHI